MVLFEAYHKDGKCVREENWDLVSPGNLNALVVYHPWLSDFSIVLEGEGKYFLWKEALGMYGMQGKLVRVGFGKEGIIKVLFGLGGTVTVEGSA